MDWPLPSASDRRVKALAENGNILGSSSDLLALEGIVVSPMYVFTENAFLSLIAHERDERLLEVRAQYKGDIERTFPEAEVAYVPDHQFPYSTTVSRERAAERIALRVQHIGYRNFNPSSEEPWRQAVYKEVESLIRMSHRTPAPGDEA